MKRTKKNKAKTNRRLYMFGLAVFIAATIAGAFYYHHYEYQALTFKFSNGSGATVSRHNFNEMTAAQKQAFLNPVNENVLHTCTGNPMDQCIATPSIDFWPGGSEGASNPYLESSTNSTDEIMGRIVNDSTDTLQLKTSSGRIISVVYPLNSVTNFNTNYEPNYGLDVDLGDEIYVSYNGSMAQNNTINTNQIVSSSLIIKGNVKAGTSTKY